MPRRALPIAYLVLWLIVAIADTRQRRTGSARAGAMFACLWIGFCGLMVFGPTAEQMTAIVPMLAICGLAIFGISFSGYRNPSNVSPRLAVLMMLGSGAGTLAMLVALLFTGLTITDPTPHARAWVGLLFADVCMAAPVFASLVPGLVPGLLRRRGRNLAHPPASHAPSGSVLPHAMTRFRTPLPPDAIRRALSQVVVPLGSSPPIAPPTYRGVIPDDGPFTLTRFVSVRNRYGQAQIQPQVVDVDLVPHGNETEVLLHAREGAAYLISALPFVATLGIGLVVTWRNLFASGLAQERAISALEVGGSIGLVIGLASFWLIHHFAVGFLNGDRAMLATLLNGHAVEEPASWIGAVVRLFFAAVGALLSAFAVLGSVLMAIVMAVKGNLQVALLGVMSLVFYGAIAWGIGRAIRSYVHHGLRRDLNRLRGIQPSDSEAPRLVYR